MRQKALYLEYFTVGWNMLEGVVALAEGSALRFSGPVLGRRPSALFALAGRTSESA